MPAVCVCNAVCVWRSARSGLNSTLVSRNVSTLYQRSNSTATSAAGTAGHSMHERCSAWVAASLLALTGAQPGLGERRVLCKPRKPRLLEGDAREGARAERRGRLPERTNGASGARGGAGMFTGVHLGIVGLRSGLARRRDAAIEIDAGDGRWGEQGGRDEGGEATGLRECPSSQGV
jgi:hypothetical protein